MRRPIQHWPMAFMPCRMAARLLPPQVAFRFVNNPRVTLRQLSEPLIEAGRREIQTACDDFALLAHDWSQLMYPAHAAKQDRLALSSNQIPERYELQSALLLSDRDGTPLAPLAMRLRAADGVHCSRSWQVRAPLSPLDELDPVMTFAEGAAPRASGRRGIGFDLALSTVGRSSGPLVRGPRSNAWPNYRSA